TPLVAVVESISNLLLRWRGGKTFTGRLFGNREELRMLMQEAAHGLTTEERAMINRVLDLQSLTVRQAMRPLSEAVVINASEPIGRALELSRDRKLTRLPVVGSRDWHHQPGRHSQNHFWRGEALTIIMHWDSILHIALRIVAVVVLVLFNAFFVAAEFALVKVRDTQLSPLALRGHK